MYVKINFTQTTPQKTVWRIFEDIVSNSTITSTAALETRSQSYHPDLQVIDFENTEIIRSVDPTGVIARINSGDTNPGRWAFHLRQEVYDDPGTYYYYTVDTDGVNDYNRSKHKVSDTLDGDITTATSIPVNEANAQDFRGTFLNTVSPAYNPREYTGLDANLGDINSFKAYLTDVCFIYSYTTGSVGTTGYTDTFNSNLSYSGPILCMQYRRFDHFNNAGNGIIPVALSQTSSRGVSFGTNEHWINTINTNGTFNQNAPLRLFNMVDAGHRIGSSYPINYGQYVAHSVGYASYEHYPANAEAVVTTTGQPTNLTKSKVIDERVNYRHATFDLASNGYGLLPWGWTNNTRGNHGGNFTELNNVYVFNGDYQPGDEIGVGEKIYSIWPGYVGYTNRFGIAIPKE